MNLKKNNAVTLVEMIATLVVSSLLVFIVSAFIHLTNRSYAETVRESGTNSSLMYGLKLIQNRIHKAKSLSEAPADGVRWLSEQLICDNTYAFGIYQATGSSTKDFVYLPDKDNTTDREAILSVPVSDPIDFSVTISGRAATITVTGTNNEIPFNVSSTVMRRS